MNERVYGIIIVTLLQAPELYTHAVFIRGHSCDELWRSGVREELLPPKCLAAALRREEEI